ncbi:MAG TPA: hypothetical protein VJZ71_01630 [Phycisphaerae bacterium]|nr:hypothetical protein [Phycisphaerae bacterium]
MTRRHLRSIKRLTAALAAGWVFGSLSCVSNVADSVGTGLSVTSATGVLGDLGNAANAKTADLDLFADTVHLTPLGR